MHSKISLLITAACFAAWPALAQDLRIDNFIGKAENGKVLYQRYCVGCHGVHGDGNGENAQWMDPKPRDFVAATFKCRSTTTGNLPLSEDLFHTLERGIVNSYMPSWNPLTKQQRADLVAYVETFSPRWKEEPPVAALVIPAETPDTPESRQRGKALFQKVECWKCHGQLGRGDGPSASTLTDSKDRPIVPYDFSVGTRFKCGVTNQDVYRIFMTGVDGTPMPSFADVIKPDEAWDLVHYLRTLQTNYKRPSATTVAKK
jgi:cytochrome c oxidase cbb3-type subunit 2